MRWASSVRSFSSPAIIPLVSEIVPLLIISKLEQYDVLGATALAVVMLAISFVLLLVINLSCSGGRPTATRTASRLKSPPVKAKQGEGA